LELLEDRVTRALGGYPKGAKTGGLHGAEQLGRRRSRSEVRCVELNAELAAGDCFANLQCVAGRGIEGGIDEVEVTNTGSHFQLLDLVGDEFRIARAISPALHIPVSAIDALVHAATLRLDRNGRAVSLV